MKKTKMILIDDNESFIFLQQKIIEQIKKIDLIQVFNNGQKAINFFNEQANPMNYPILLCSTLICP